MNINLVIADRTYPMRISADEEEMIRKAAREINEKIKTYQADYPTKDKQDFMAMISILYAMEFLRSSASRAQEAEIVKKNLIVVERELDRLLAE